MHWIAKHLYFERRRIITSGALAFIAGVTLHSHMSIVVWGLPFAFMTGLSSASAVATSAAVTTFFRPNFRWLVDSMSVTRLGFAAWVVGTHSQEFAASPWASATVIGGSAILTRRLCVWINTLGEENAGLVILSDVAGHIRPVMHWVDNHSTRDREKRDAATPNSETPVSCIRPLQHS